MGSKCAVSIIIPGLPLKKRGLRVDRRQGNSTAFLATYASRGLLLTQNIGKDIWVHVDQGLTSGAYRLSGQRAIQVFSQS